ncbi:MAG: DUF2244 domain-containing protein [Alphaproteobacteria bacterium HGW-Alphaproteobacteria-2]|nr:MAG: DUF2244 domain-containing protein [Alphaproteobacteria bacterium HGW-Alphaproteobacteria-2]
MSLERLTTNGAPAEARAPFDSGAVLLDIVLRPNRSLGPRGFAWVIGLACAGFLLPLLALLGTLALWAMLPFMLGAVVLLWHFIRRNSADGGLWERVTLTRTAICITRHEPSGAERRWQADPYWTRLLLHPEGGPVEDYLTLRGGGREVELGAFLSPGERRSLHGELQAAFDRLNRFR